MKEVLRFIKYLLVILVTPLLLYIFFAFIGSVISIDKKPYGGNPEVEIFLWTNGVHTDLVLPVTNAYQDWYDFIDPGQVPTLSKDFKYIAFGWGDLEFYRKVPTWDELTPVIAVKSILPLSPSAMHVKFHYRMAESENSVPVKMDSEQYLLLTEFIKKSFEYNDRGEIQKIEDLHYSDTDAFFHARGSLHAFYTCNTWTNRALKNSGLPSCLWTPFAEGIFFQYR